MATKAPQKSSVKKKVVGYIRVSRVGGRGGDSFISPDQQRREIESLALREGLDLVEILEPELNKSGGDASRPIWNEAITMVETGRVHGIVCWNLSRFSRNTIDALTALSRIEQAGGRLYTTDKGDETASGEFQTDMMLALAKMERRRATEGFRSAIEAAVERGIATMSRIPFGYRRDPETRRLVVEPDEAALVVETFERRTKRESWERLASFLRESGLEISPSGVRALVRNRTYLGEIRSGEATKAGAHEAIISQRLFDAANETRGKRSPGDGSLTRSTLLQSAMRCGSCGRPMHTGSSRYKGERVAHYYCRSIDCTERAFTRSAPLDHYAQHLIRALFDTHIVATPDEDVAEAAAAQERLLDAQHAVDQWVAQSALMDVLGAEAYVARTEELVTARNLAQAEVEQARSALSTFEGFDAVWQEWTTETRRDFIARERIEVVLGHGRAPLEQRAILTIDGEPVSLEDIMQRGMAHDG